MKDIVIIGAGGLAREVKYVINDINKIKLTYNFIGYIISDLKKLGEYDSKDEVIGDFSWFKGKDNKLICVAIGIGNPKVRINISKLLINKFPYLEFPPIIHPSVKYDEHSCEINQGVIICASTILTVNVIIKEFSFINLLCAVGHEAVIGKGTVINSLTQISGGVKLGEGVLIGANSIILQYIDIGDYSIVGAGACLTKSIPDNVVAFGVPAKVVKKFE